MIVAPGEALVTVVRPDQRYVIDGALATELERRGADLDDSLWSAKVLIESPGLIEELHYDYFVAGADIATSASYQASFAGFAKRGVGPAKVRRLLRDSVALALTARERFRASAPPDPRRPPPLVAASIGAFGAHRHDGSEYSGNYRVTERVLLEHHRRQLDVLAMTRADLIAFETIPSLAEGEVIVRLLQEFPELKAWISFSCRDEGHVCHGERFAACAALANEHAGIVATGVNCSAPGFVEALLGEAAQVTRKILLAYPNSGEGWCAADNGWCGDPAAESLASHAPRWLRAGASWLGGCCRTGPDDIRELAAVLHESAGQAAGQG